tara:strand:+ start:188 stop:409 length:222 start_codon:yes stop_codon:yes gene_type:complete
MKKTLFILTALLTLLIFVPQKESKASYHGPWYACYIEQNSVFQKCIGPYQNKYACMGNRYSIPFGARWLGCFM